MTRDGLHKEANNKDIEIYSENQYGYNYTNEYTEWLENELIKSKWNNNRGNSI